MRVMLHALICDYLIVCRMKCMWTFGPFNFLDFIRVFGNFSEIAWLP